MLPQFYEQGELTSAPFLEIPSHQYGPLLTNPTRNNFSLLEPLRPFWEGPYAWQGVVVPRCGVLLNSGGATGLAPLQQAEDRVQLPAGSWLVGFAAYSAQAAGFRFSIFDVGANDYCLNQAYESNQAGAQVNSDTDPAIPHILPVPYCLVAAFGQTAAMQIEVVNSANAYNDCQLLLHFAVPRAGSQ